MPGATTFRHWRTSAFIAALRCARIEAPWLLDGHVNGDISRTHVEQVLVPTLSPGDVIILDNHGSHKVAAIRKAIRAAGAAHLLFLCPQALT